MSSAIAQLMKSFDETDKLWKRIDLYSKKQERMGLSEEEEKFLNELKMTYYVKIETIISDVVDAMLDQVLSEEAYVHLSNIQKFVPWSGRLLIDSKEVDEIMDTLEELSELDKDYIGSELKNLHREVFTCINEACQNDEFLDNFDKLGLVVTNGVQDSDILDALNYINTIYVEFGEMVGVILDPVMLEFEEEE